MKQKKVKKKKSKKALILGSPQWIKKETNLKKL